jgi:hypothetical protein
MMIMPNNLEECIKRAGMTRKECGASMPNGGIAPETVSRHISGKIGMTLSLAEDYAHILGCTAYDVLFQAAPVPIIAECTLRTDKKVKRNFLTARKGKVYGSTLASDTAAIIWSKDSDYHGIWDDWASAVEYVCLSPITQKYIGQKAIMNWAYCLLENPIPFEDDDDPQQIVAGFLYPEPDGLYTIDNKYIGKRLTNQKLIWATSRVAVSFRPELRGVEIVYDK